MRDEGRGDAGLSPTPCALAVGATATLLTAEVVPAGLARLSAAAGLAVVGSPMTVTISNRPTNGGTGR